MYSGSDPLAHAEVKTSRKHSFTLPLKRAQRPSSQHLPSPAHSSATVGNQISRRRGSVAWSSARFGSLVRVVLCLDSKLAAPISFCC
ncbi:hypothetical protein CXB51_035078 [Gossypium anomalum]|uniref:Uncharacterized protein n=1 Tax=Gossypium anomalum TaxID=47600 RepID=A0A8J5XYE9_9ROSI|nr:hypothetical protein CXB51_035078 [Gossypium anomalum]